MKTCQKNFISPVSGLNIFLLALCAILVILPVTIKAQWNNNTSVNLQISGLTDDDMETVSTTDNKTWIAFYSQNGGSYDMRAQLIDANGYKLLGPDGVLVSNQPTGTAIFVFNVCLDNSNNLIIGCQDERTGTMQTVLYKISQAGAHLWGSSGIVLGPGLAPYPATLTTGEVVVSWDGDNGNTLNLQKITTGGTLAWATPITITVSGGATTRGQLIANTAGKFTMVYQKRGSGISTTLYAQMFNNAGTAVYSPLQICNQTTSGARYYSILSENDTTYFGYYASSGFRFNSFLQRINPTGTIPWGMNGSNFNTSVAPSDNYQMETSIGLTPGTNYVWSVCTFSDFNQTLYGVYVQKFLKMTGARQFTDAGKVVYAISSNTDRAAGNVVLVNATPMFMSYDVSGKIFATRLDASGGFVWPGNRVELSSTNNLTKMRYGFTADGPNKCAGVWIEDRGAGYLGYAQGVSIGGLIGLTVTTQGGVPATITTVGGTLQMVATVYPATANQNVTWSIVPGTGSASISTGGLVSAVTDGTVYAKAVSVQDITVKDSLMITISNQVPMPPAVTTLPATNITGTSATLNGSVIAFSSTATVTFNWGLTAAYGTTVSASPSTVSGNSATPVAAGLTGLQQGTLYHYRCVSVNSVGTTYGGDMTFTTCLTPGTPSAITGQAVVCQNQNGVTYSITAVPNATTYNWIVPNGASITAGAGTTSITVSYGSSAVSGNITVSGANSCIEGPSSTLAVTVNPAPLPVITGPNAACAGSANYTYSTEAGMSNYSWTVSSGGSIASGSGTNSVIVHWNTTGFQNVQVNYSNLNGCTAATPTAYDVIVEDIPAATGSITGSDVVCAGSQGIAYTIDPVAGATSYSWILPPGAAIVSGSGTNSIVADYAFNSVSGSVTVSGANSCGNGNSSSLSVTVNPAPPTPVITANGYELNSNAASGNQWYRDGILIPGANTQTYDVTMTGWYWTVVTTGSCPSDSSNNIHIVFVGMEDKNDLHAEIYPVPNDGLFNISISNGKETTYTLEIYNILGTRACSDRQITVNGNKLISLDLRPLPSGMYTIILSNGKSRETYKMIVN